MDWSFVVDYLMSLAPWVEYVFVALGTLVLMGTVVDSMVPDEKDKGFMKKILELPMIGSLLSFLTRFSPFNIKSDK